jgi:hypothetical protein
MLALIGLLCSKAFAFAGRIHQDGRFAEQLHDGGDAFIRY